MLFLKMSAEYIDLGCMYFRKVLQLRVVKLSISKQTNFDLNQEILISPIGYAKSHNFQRNGLVKFGRATPGNTCDISFHVEDLEVSRNHFTIHYDEGN